IRQLLSEDGLQLEGSTIEMDETYFGGKIERQGSQGRSKDKVPIIGMVERGGRIVARVAPNAKRETLHGLAKKYILPASTIFTDEFVAYDGLDKLGYTHRRIKHSAGVYVSGDVHTQAIEGFWSTVKRGIGGVYHNVSAKYLQTYLNEYCFRYNRRHQG